MTAVCNRIEEALKVVLCVILTAMTITVVWQVLSRFLAQISTAYNLPLLIQPARWTEELASFQLLWLAMLGAAYAYRNNEHLGFDYLYGKMSDAGKHRVDLVANIIVAIFAVVVLAYGGARLAWLTYELHQVTSALQWPRWAVYSVIPLTGLLITIFAIEGIVAWRRPEKQPGISGEEAAP
jgi:TRAP-type C4-dicarboxylate transport system permease small subunit